MNNHTDTNQASELFELCRSVYERTGWEAPGTLWSEGTGALGSDEMCPLYTSDYLLEKLQSWFYDMGANDFGQFNVTVVADAYIAQIHSHDRELLTQTSSDTPLKALLKLTIALSEAGELK